jgi:uncharacterized protein YcaQ
VCTGARHGFRPSLRIDLLRDPGNPMTDVLGVDSIARELRACGEDELVDIRASFEVVAADHAAPAWWRRLAELAIVAIDRMGGGVDPAVTLRDIDGDLMAGREATLAGADALAGSRSRARRHRRSPP